MDSFKLRHRLLDSISDDTKRIRQAILPAEIIGIYHNFNRKMTIINKLNSKKTGDLVEDYVSNPILKVLCWAISFLMRKLVTRMLDLK